MQYTKENPLRCFFAFAGYDSQALALRRLGIPYVCVGWSEIDKHAITAHDALFPEDKDKNFGDISKIDWTQVPDFDLFTYSFPCGLAGTMVKTFGSYRKIEDLQVGDLVLTYKNRYRRVTKTMQRNAPAYFNIDAVGCHLKLTGEHPLWVLRDGEQQWVKVKDLQLTDKLSYCIPQGETDTDLDDDTLWLLGRYVADGWVNPRLYHSVCFAVGFEKVEKFETHLPKCLGAKRTKKTCWEYRIANEKFQHLCLECGDGAKNKRVPSWVLALPAERIKVFLDGYFSGDGHVRYKGETKIQMFSTVSKELALGIQLCLLKVYNKVCSISIRHDERKKTFNDTYNGQIAFSETTQQIVIEDMCFVPVRSIEEVKGSVRVYNVSVEEDESYTCDNVNTHNCTDISAAGQQRGFDKDSGTRSSLLWECEKAIEIKKPKYLLMENVKALVQKKFKAQYDKWLMLLHGYGYANFWQVLNAKDYGVPQNRERVFCISILRTDDEQTPSYVFPEPFQLERRLKDVLEDEVDEKYYLSDKMLEYFNRVNEDKSHGHDFKPTDGGVLRSQ